MITTTQARMLHEILNGAAFRPPTNRITIKQYETMYEKFNRLQLSKSDDRTHHHTCNSTIRGSESDDKLTYKEVIAELRHKLYFLQDRTESNASCILTFSSTQLSSSQPQLLVNDQTVKDKVDPNATIKIETEMEMKTELEEDLRPPFSYEHLSALVHDIREALAPYPFAGTVESLLHALWDGTDCSHLIFLLKYSVDQYSRLTHLEAPVSTLHRAFHCVSFSVSRERGLREAIPWTERAQTVIEYIIYLLPSALRTDVQALFLKWAVRQYQRGPLAHHFKVNLPNELVK